LKVGCGGGSGGEKVVMVVVMSGHVREKKRGKEEKIVL
jgi:hypothetical protein